jgi:hypothetical protein
MPQRPRNTSNDLIPLLAALAVVLATQVLLSGMAISSGASYGISIGLGLVTLWRMYARKSSD